MDIKQQKKIDMSNKENIFENLQFALNFFDWSLKEKAKKKWLKLLEQAKNGDDNSYEFLISQNGINEFNNYLSSFFTKRGTTLVRFQQIENYLKSYLCNNLEAKGQYNSFYFYNNSKMMRISDHFAVPKKNYIKINSKIYLGLLFRYPNEFFENNIKYECDIVILIPNFFNVNRKKQALLLILEKKLNLILEKIKKNGQILNQPIMKKKFTHNFYENLSNLMTFFKENSIELNIFKNINN